ncbi:RNA-directed DNA polymerase [Xanthobacter dioxanivorans]|nr:RNA-directed DNA polymerase [Xanthobacter dioxanivorans]
MSLKRDLLAKGYLPENLPPIFSSVKLGDFLSTRSDYQTHKKIATRPATHNSSKRGMTRRQFSVAHPVMAHDSAKIIDDRSSELNQFFLKSNFSLSRPIYDEKSDRAVNISTHSELEKVISEKLSVYRFIAKTDISRFYHSIYTHSIPWALHGRLAAKEDRSFDSNLIWGNKIDQIIRQGQDGQTIGIPVGPDASRYFAEIVATAIDADFEERFVGKNIGIVRHVDDVWIGANSHGDAEQALWKYRESIRHFELDINESKTKIYDADFSFADYWPLEISNLISLAVDGPPRRSEDRLRSALEFAFSLAVKNNDDGILKYTIRQIDNSGIKTSYWNVFEPFLKRVTAHFGHAVDYVMRVIIWRQYVKGDVDINVWSGLIKELITKHGRLGNDSEVCWLIFASLRLNIDLKEIETSVIANNCASLSILSTLVAAELGMMRKSIFDDVIPVCGSDGGYGPYWPVIMEWKTRDWPRKNKFPCKNELMKDIQNDKISLILTDAKIHVFDDVDEGDFSAITRAIEPRISIYDNDGEGDEDEEEFLF